LKRITIYRHKDCAKCARIARMHRFFDWLHRVETSTEVPGTGPLQLGEIAVEDARTGEITKGVEAVRRICRQIPAYAPLLPLLHLPFVARKVDREVRGCASGACSPASEQPREGASAGRA
jgi:hypothetical protein